MAAKVLELWQSRLVGILAFLCPVFLVCLSVSRAFHSLLLEPTVFPNDSDCLFAWPTTFDLPNHWLRSSPRLPRSNGPVCQACGFLVEMPNLIDHLWCLRLLDGDLLWLVMLWRRRLWLNPCDRWATGASPSRGCRPQSMRLLHHLPLLDLCPFPFSSRSTSLFRQSSVLYHDV